MIENGAEASARPPRVASPVVVLVRPQLAENIGAVARAMLNFGLGDLRLVAPRAGWPHATAYRSAAGADVVLDRAVVFGSTAAAVADVSLLYAATARLRDMIKPVSAPRAAALELREAAAAGARCAVLFGPERTGLDNDDVVLAARLLHIPANPDFSSLNLAQAVLVLAWEWWALGGEAAVRPHRGPRPTERPATHQELSELLTRLEGELERKGFFEVPEKRPSMERNIRNVFTRAELTQQEVRTLHGIVTALLRRGRGSPTDGGGEP
ncbi:MAG TPA: RNA methyltransferase [Thermoanaerobaculia bacterium]|nr:RNA methyltransferase [Thermoanaerobaculia bacterium]